MKDATLNRRSFLKSAALGIAVVGAAPRTLVSFAQTEPDEFDITGGALIAHGDEWLAIEVNNQAQRFSINANTPVWKGGETSYAALAQGDDIMLRILAATGQVLRVWSNLTRVRGQVIRIQQDGYVLQTGDPLKAPSALLLTIGSGAQFGNMMTGRSIDAPVSLVVGDYVDAVGERTTEGVQATRIYSYHPDGSPMATPKDSSRARKFTTPTCGYYTYTGTSTWFDCGNGAGRCGTCNTSNSNQAAWPTLDSCCSGCCQFSTGCYDQVKLSCGSTGSAPLNRGQATASAGGALTRPRRAARARPTSSVWRGAGAPVTGRTR